MNGAIADVETKDVAVSDVVFREDLYPRIDTIASKVQQYAEDLSVLPPIEINQKNELIDGWHRWTAHKKAKAETIKAVVTETASDDELLELSAERNAKFGQQLSSRDKRRISARIYHATPPEERGQKKQRLADILSVSYDTVNRWLSRIDKDSEEERNAAVLNLYLQCYTEHEIADRVGMPRSTVQEVLTRIGKYEIPSIPGQFTDGQPDDSATDKVKREWEEQRQQKIVEYNQACADHSFELAAAIPDESTPLIFTDPPYGRESLHPTPTIRTSRRRNRRSRPRTTQESCFRRGTHSRGDFRRLSPA